MLAILAGVLFNRSDVKDLRLEMQSGFNKMGDSLVRLDSSLRQEMLSRFNCIDDHLGRIDADLRQFYHLTGKLEARMDTLEKNG